MKRRTNFLTENDCYKAARPLKPTGILVHSTGVNQKRIGPYTSQWNRPGVQVCVHGFLGLDGDGELCYEQILPYSMRCWGCGSGSLGSYNATHIQFEICEDITDRRWLHTTYDAAKEICRELCLQYGIDPANVVTHSEAHAMGYASSHADVMHWWPIEGLDMDRFRKELREELKDEMENNDKNYAVFKAFMARYEAEQRALPPSDYAAESCRKGVASGLFTDGSGDGSIDWPHAYLKRQELAVLMDRRGELD